jgi:hypothetical protein
VPHDANGIALKGGYYLDRAFMSCTPILEVAENYAKRAGGDVLLEILVPSGYSFGGYIERWSWIRKEREFLLAEGSGGIIVGTREGKGGLQIVTLLMELL